MAVITGVFQNAERARCAAANLSSEVAQQRIYVLTPGDADAEIHSVPTTQDMAPVSKYLALVLGAALGLGFGTVLFMAVLEVPLPLALFAIVVLGAVGAFLMGRVGRGVDQRAFQGLPADEVFIYKDALRRGRAIVLVRLKDDKRADVVKDVLAANGAESLDPARKDAAVGLGSAEEREYHSEKSGVGGAGR